jgi:hypothetical protein
LCAADTQLGCQGWAQHPGVGLADHQRVLLTTVTAVDLLTLF